MGNPYSRAAIIGKDTKEFQELIRERQKLLLWNCVNSGAANEDVSGWRVEFEAAVGREPLGTGSVIERLRLANQRTENDLSDKGYRSRYAGPGPQQPWAVAAAIAVPPANNQG